MSYINTPNQTSNTQRTSTPYINNTHETSTPYINDTHDQYTPPPITLTLRSFYGWLPPSRFKASFNDMIYMYKTIDDHWSKKSFQRMIKNFERELLSEFSYIINGLDDSRSAYDFLQDWADRSFKYWKRLALVRDYHDYRCGRDSTHHIRTDYCHRFVSCVMSGVQSGSFTSPVKKLLTGTTSPRNFTHHMFRQFNTT